MTQKCYAIIEVASEEVMLNWPARIIAAQEVTYADPEEDWPALTFTCDANEDSEPYLNVLLDGDAVSVPAALAVRIEHEGIVLAAVNRIPRLDRYMAPFSACHCEEVQRMGLVMATGFKLSPVVEITFADTGDDSCDTWRLNIAVSPILAATLKALHP
jgi:hypothetical protein